MNSPAANIPGIEEIPAAAFDPEPGHLKIAPGGRGRGREKAPKGKPVRLTAAITKDIAAKVKLMVVMPGKVWEVRDPACGGIWMEQSDDISEALTEIVLDSPDLVNFFTSSAGGFMKWFKLAAAVQPVGVMVWAHHVAHTVAVVPQGEAGQQMPAYAA